MTKKVGDRTDSFWRASKLALTLLGGFVFFTGLTMPFFGPDEPRYAQVAREMFLRGDWVTPTLGGHTWFEKPILLYWLEIASYHLFGVNEFAARFGPALFGIGVCVCLWLLGRFVSSPGSTDAIQESDRSPAKHDLAFWFGVIAASSIGLIAFSHGASFDIILTFPITASLIAYFIFDQSDPAKDRARMLALASFYVFIGVGFLAKGLVGIVFPFGIVGFFHIVSRRWPQRVVWPSLGWGTLLIAIVSGLWYIPVYHRNGWPFIEEFFVQHHFQRYTSNKYFHPQPFYFFFLVLPLMSIPWLPFLGAWLWRRFKKFRSETDHKASPLTLFALSWIAVPLVFFSFSGSKLPGYILPALPPLTVLAGIEAARFAASSIVKRYLTLGIGGATFLVIIVLFYTAVPPFADNDSVKRLINEADAQGFSNSMVVNLHTASHNAEFYAAGRILRSEDGAIKKLYGPEDVYSEIAKAGGKTVLVLVPNHYVEQLTTSSLLSTKIIASNSELTVAAASPKSTP